MTAEYLPLVSVIVPAYNASAFIEQTLQSILNQTYHHFEALIIDDGSTDETGTIAQKFIIKDNRFRLIQQPNAGVAAARNHGIQVAKGELIAPLDADDIWHRDNLEKQVKRLLLEPNSVGMVYSWSADINPENLLTSNVRAFPYYGNILPVMLLHNVVGNASASMIRRSCLADIGGYNTNFVSQQAQGCEDWDLYLRISEKYQVAIIPELLVGYRQVPESMSNNLDQMTRSKSLTLERIKEKYPHVYCKVMKWCNAIDSLVLGNKYYKIGCNRQAWSAVFQAYQSDWAMAFSYMNFRLVIQLVWKSLHHLFTNQPTQHAPVTLGDSTISFQSTSPSKSSRTQYITFFISLLFPITLLRSLRTKWIHSQVCPDHPLPKSVPLWKMLEKKLYASENGGLNFYQHCLPVTDDPNNAKARHVSQVMRNE